MPQNDQLNNLDTALFSLMRVAKRPAYWDEFQRKAGLQIDRPAAAILLLLNKHPMQFSEVVISLGIEAPSISRKVHELEEANFINREPTSDKRVHMLALTTQGSSLAAKILSARLAMLEEVTVSWSESDTKQLSELLSRLASDLATSYGNKKVNQG